MEILSIYNTLTKNNQELMVVDGRPFGVYCCGPTVYNYAHLGNFRTFILQDILLRVLKVAGYEVKFVRNLTDVDDKTIKNSLALGVSLREFTKKWENVFHDDCQRLNLLVPDVEPRATEHIKEQIALIEKLISKGHAYMTEDGSIYYDVSSFGDYGKLSGVNIFNLEHQSANGGGDRNESDEYARESVRDFALWKAKKATDGENFWPSPWGDGRPGWHIECSAMSMKYLGHTIDLHCGGVDLCFPHHENEIAQSEAATGEIFSRYWFHTAHLLMDGEKMSKSLGNIFSLNDIVSKGFSPMVIKYALMACHYSQQLNFTTDGLRSAASAIHRIITILSRLKSLTGCASIADVPFAGWKYFGEAWMALKTDLNTPRCLGSIFSVLNELNLESLPSHQWKHCLAEICKLLYALGLDNMSNLVDAIVPGAVQAMAEERWAAKLSKNFTLADELRQKINDAGWEINDAKTSYEIFKSF
ncbi:MAG: cysteine--tRNA ligase [Puniceicoccales bacterium]|jgi:cysteinyl-tRNA synthetase|nr:cysteine--tRNA ligase [Puniceicoccales bacterium]